MTEMFDRNQGVSEWFDILNWDMLPDMGACHPFAAAGKLSEFERRFVMTDELGKFSGTLAEKFESDRATQPIVALVGVPGIGKTTFIYLLSSFIHSNNELKDKYTFYPFQANKICNVNWKYEVYSAIKSALRLHFGTTGNKNAFNAICEAGPDTEKGLEVQLNELKTYLTDNRQKFKKTLIFVLDNVDTVNESSRVLEAFNLINTVLEPAIIKKWFVVRPETIESYSNEEKERFNSFNADRLVLPQVSLYEVVCKRVINTTVNHDSNKKILNPFDKELCNTIIQPLCKGNLRRGLSVVESLIRDTSPKEFSKSTDETVLQNYLRKSVVPVLFNQDLLVNLHSIKYSSKTLETPMAYDLLCLTRYASEINLLGALLFEATERRNKQKGYGITGRENKFTIRDHEVVHILKKLHDDGLVIYKNEEQEVILTQLGNAHINIATPKFFAEVCKTYGNSIRTQEYWEASAVSLAYSSLGRLLSTSKII